MLQCLLLPSQLPPHLCHHCCHLTAPTLLLCVPDLSPPLCVCSHVGDVYFPCPSFIVLLFLYIGVSPIRRKQMLPHSSFSLDLSKPVESVVPYLKLELGLAVLQFSSFPADLHALPPSPSRHIACRKFLLCSFC